MKRCEYDNVLKKIQKIAEGIVGKKYKVKIDPDKNLSTDLGFDSIMGLRMIVELERAFKIDIANFDDEIDFAEYDTINKITELVCRLVKNRN